MIEFYNAVKALVPSQVEVHLFTAKLSSPPKTTDYPYVVLWGPPPTAFSGDGPEFPSSEDKPDSVFIDLRVTYAATSATSLSATIKGVQDALNRATPLVAGYACNRLRLSALTPIQPDRDVSIGSLNPLYAVDETTLTAHRNT